MSESSTSDESGSAAELSSPPDPEGAGPEGAGPEGAGPEGAGPEEQGSAPAKAESRNEGGLVAEAEAPLDPPDERAPEVETAAEAAPEETEAGPVEGEPASAAEAAEAAEAEAAEAEPPVGDTEPGEGQGAELSSAETGGGEETPSAEASSEGEPGGAIEAELQVSAPAPLSPLVVVEQLRLGGKGGRRELLLPSFELWPGVTGLVGPSGVGKTSFCEVLLGLSRGSGRVEVLGHSLPKAGPRVRSEVGYLAQDLAVYPGMTAMEFSTFVGQAQPRWRPKKVFERLARYQVPTRVPVEQLPPRPRAFLAMALAFGTDPRLAIVDLPTCLDGSARADLLEALLAERGETALLIATARPHELEGRCDEVLLLGGSSSELCSGPDLASGIWRLDLRGDARPPLDPALTCIQAGPGPSGARWIVAGSESLLPSDPEQVSSVRPATYEEAALAKIAALQAR